MVAMATSKNDRHTIDKIKFLQRMNEQLLKVSAPQSKLFSQKFEKKPYGGVSYLVAWSDEAETCF